MELREAIEKVLSKSNTPLSPIRIADIINTFLIYRRNDGLNVPNIEIVSEVKKHKDIFNLKGKNIALSRSSKIKFSNT